MICHRQLGGTVPRQCLGSACAMWVPEIAVYGYANARKRGSDGGVVSTGARMTGHAGDPITIPDGPTGLGWCADNLRREPFLDPNAPVRAKETP